MVDHHFLNSRGVVYPWAYRVESAITRRLPDAILASSGQAIDLLREEFKVPPERIYSLPDCVDAGQFDPARFPLNPAEHPLRAALGIPEGAAVVGYLGLLTDYQGIPHLIESAVDLRQRGEPIHFLIMGYPSVERYQSIARLRGVDDMMTFTGRIPFTEAPYYLAACDIAVAPKMSASEGSGKLLNYMAMALPIVAYDTSVNREYLADLGVYAPVGNVGAFTEAMVGLLRDPQGRVALGIRLRERAIDKFSWAAAADCIMAIYYRLTKLYK
jgi:glycosyltransferase involved in cell wall biosynthesis